MCYKTTCGMCSNPQWYGGIGDNNQIHIDSLLGLTIRQSICKLFSTTSSDIKNSPGMYRLCGEEIIDFNTIIDESFLFKCLSTRPKKMDYSSIHKRYLLTEDNYNLCKKRFYLTY